MKKAFRVFVVLVIVQLACLNGVSAMVEKVSKSENVIVSHEEQLIDTSKLMCDVNPVYGNNIYLQVNSAGKNIGEEIEYDISVPDQYKKDGFSNSPLYIYDEELNLIETIEFDDYISGIRYIGGYFYISKIKYGGENIDYGYYKCLDYKEMIEIPSEEYLLAVHRTELSDGTAYTWEKYEYEENGIIHATQDKVEYIIENGVMYPIVRENNKYIYSKNMVSATDINLHITVNRSINDYNDLSKCYMKISLDGISSFDVPIDTDINRIWNDSEFLYLGILDDDMNCYRIPLDKLQNNIKVKYKDKFLSFATPPVIEDDRTLVPMRFLFEVMGANVEWDNNSQTATVNRDDDIISFSINEREANVNGKKKNMDVPARLINDKTLIPLRFLSEELGFNVEWDETTLTATISR